MLPFGVKPGPASYQNSTAPTSRRGILAKLYFITLPWTYPFVVLALFVVI